MWHQTLFNVADLAEHDDSVQLAGSTLVWTLLTEAIFTQVSSIDSVLRRILKSLAGHHG